MANKNFKLKENSPGLFFVDDECIACDNCAYIAPLHFKLSPNNAYAFVHHQPATQKEMDSCLKALKACPVFCIGIDK